MKRYSYRLIWVLLLSEFINGPVEAEDLQTKFKYSNVFSSTDSVENIDKSIQPRIIGGTFAAPDEYPWFVRFTNFDGTTQGCAGSLVTDEFVLTAGHCLRGQGYEIDPVTETLLEIGKYCVDASCQNEVVTNVETVGVSQSIIHPDYNTATFEYDFALLKLNESISISPIAMDQGQYSPIYDNTKELWVAGLGETDTGGGGVYPDILLHTNVLYVEQSDCENSFTGVANIIDAMLCAIDDGKDGCQGDSGGPLYDKENDALVGIVSFGIGCASPIFPGVYSRISDQWDWIRKNICDNSDTLPDFCITPAPSVDSQEPSQAPIVFTKAPVELQPSELPSVLPSTSTNPSGTNVPSAAPSVSATPSSLDLSSNPSSSMRPSGTKIPSAAPSVSATPSSLDLSSNPSSSMRPSGTKMPSAAPSASAAPSSLDLSSNPSSSTNPSGINVPSAAPSASAAPSSLDLSSNPSSSTNPSGTEIPSAAPSASAAPSSLDLSSNPSSSTNPSGTKIPSAAPSASAAPSSLDLSSNPSSSTNPSGTKIPSAAPSASAAPSSIPSSNPSRSMFPSSSHQPSTSSSEQSALPSSDPSVDEVSLAPAMDDSKSPSSIPTFSPSAKTLEPSNLPTEVDLSLKPSMSRSNKPSARPSSHPSVSTSTPTKITLSPVTSSPVVLSECENPLHSLMEFEITPDVYGKYDNSFNLLVRKEGRWKKRVRVRSFQSSKLQTVTKCVPTRNCYKATVLDKYGDGICCSYGQGSYVVKWEGTVVASSNFLNGRKETSNTFGDGC